MSSEPYDWRRDGACHPSKHPNGIEIRTKGELVRVPVGTLFFRKSLVAARKMCADCPVRRRCRLEADAREVDMHDDQLYGVWGGASAAERAKQRALRGWTPPPEETAVEIEERCGRGHVKTPENTLQLGNGRTRCGECNNEDQAAYRLRKRER